MTGTVLIPIGVQEGQIALFDYERLEVQHREPIRVAAEEIRHYFRGAVESYIKIGAKLKEVQPLFPSIKAFDAWFEVEFRGSQRTAYNLIRLHDQFAQVENHLMEQVGLGVLYELAANSVPQAARETVLKLAGDGKKVTKPIARTIIEQAKAAEAAQQTSLLEPGEDAAPAEDAPEVCLCGHFYEEHEEGAANCKECTCECYEIEKVDRSNVETLVEQTETITETTTVETVAVVPAPVAAPERDIAGQAQLLFEAATINISLTIYPQKGDDRDCLVSLRAGNGLPLSDLIKYSQITDIFRNYTLAKQILALKADLVAEDEARKAKPAPKPASTTKTTKTTTTKVAAKKGKK